MLAATRKLGLRPRSAHSRCWNALTLLTMSEAPVRLPHDRQPGERRTVAVWVALDRLASESASPRPKLTKREMPAMERATSRPRRQCERSGPPRGRGGRESQPRHPAQHVRLRHRVELSAGGPRESLYRRLAVSPAAARAAVDRGRSGEPRPSQEAAGPLCLAALWPTGCSPGEIRRLRRCAVRPDRRRTTTLTGSGPSGPRRAMPPGPRPQRGCVTCASPTPPLRSRMAGARMWPGDDSDTYSPAQPTATLISTTQCSAKPPSVLHLTL